MRYRVVLSAATAAVFLFTASVALAATSEQKCLGGRAKAQGKYQSCVQKVLSKRYGGAGLNEKRFSKCREKYAAAWTKLQKLTGTTCDAPRWVDNGNGTVTDNLTGLVWQKTDDLGGLTDKDNRYTWTDVGDGDFTDEDGTAFTDFLANLNAGAGFAGANGWKLPTFAELHTILLPEPYPCSTNPCIDQSVFGPTTSSLYWSSTTYESGPTLAWLVFFYDGSDGAGSKADGYWVRAVRGGL